ncbi:hypothetical protein CDAR_94741 [Caerostris darwini]|uniref:Uncharacterized protein n=1 Tax=Caerostris darwini TaxID=1538125 RepID=A0AAV4PLE3_9ARAC|nr:hypothetical protein CDAR_94741 [Caerostris darwini]
MMQFETCVSAENLIPPPTSQQLQKQQSMRESKIDAENHRRVPGRRVAEIFAHESDFPSELNQRSISRPSGKVLDPRWICGLVTFR